MRIFLDVGGNVGQTINAVLEERHGFDRMFLKYGFEKVYCFEPVEELYQYISTRYCDPRINVLPSGLWNQTCEKLIFSPGSSSGSIFPDKINVDPEHSTLCKFVRASDWFRDHLTGRDDVYVKLNCEGCEADIIEDLLDSNEYRKIRSLGVTFDVRKIPSQRNREEEIKRRLEAGGYVNVTDLNTLGIDVVDAESHSRMIEKWLWGAGAERSRSFANRVRQKMYHGAIFGARCVRYARRRIGISTD